MYASNVYFLWLKYTLKTSKFWAFFLSERIKPHLMPHLAGHWLSGWCSHLGGNLALTASALWFDSHILIFANSDLCNSNYRQNKVSSVELNRWLSWSGFRKTTADIPLYGWWGCCMGNHGRNFKKTWWKDIELIINLSTFLTKQFKLVLSSEISSKSE